MPYIDKAARQELDRFERHPTTPGELNYMITMQVLLGEGMRQQVVFDRLLDRCRQYIGTKGLSYQHINDVLGALYGASMELNRRCRHMGVECLLLREVALRFYETVAAPYEDTKITANGDLPFERLR